MSITIYMGRHGETKLNSEERLRSWIDEPLNKAGVEEAEAMGEAMKKYPIDRIYCSDLDRADHTAQIVAKHHGLKQIPRQWFRPLDYGGLSGKKISEIQPQLDKLNKIWQTDPDHEVPGGESLTEFQNRNLGGLNALMKTAEDGEEVMIVAHLRNCLLFHGVAVTGGPLKGPNVELLNGKSWHQESGSVSKFEFDNERLKYIGMVFDPSGEKKEASVS